MVDISCVQKDIGYQFQDEAIINEALTAAGVAGSSDQNNPDKSNYGNKRLAMPRHAASGPCRYKTLLFCENNQELFTILSSTIGVVFMGVPHHGSQLATSGRKIFKFPNLFKRVNHQMLGNLQPSSQLGQAVLEDYASMLQHQPHVRTFCFYEAKGVMSARDIVPKESAIMRGHDSLSIDDDHMGMDQVSGEDDANYKLVVDLLRRWTDGGMQAGQRLPATAQSSSAAAASGGPAAHTTNAAASVPRGAGASTPERPADAKFNFLGTNHAKNIVNGIVCESGPQTLNFS